MSLNLTNLELAPGNYQNIISKIWKFSKYAFFSFIFYLLAVNFNLFWLFGKMPSFQQLDNPQSELASEIISSDGKVIGKFFYENRSPVEFNQISPNIINALVATEDARFTQHSGIDARSLFRVFAGLLTGRSGSAGGGSTITQQLAKNLFKLRKDDSFKGILYKVPGVRALIIKTKEWIMAVKLERRYTKQEIMMMYLNTIEFSSGAYGIKSAARTYFGKDPNDVTIEEAAMLVGMAQNPTRFNPKFHPEAAKTRRNVVFEQMAKYDKITEEQAEKSKAIAIKLKYVPESHNTGLAPYFREYLKDWMKDELKKLGYAEDDLYTKGFKIYTTIDSRMQTYAEEAMIENMKNQQAKFNLRWEGRSPWTYNANKIAGGKEVYKELPGFIEDAAKRSWHYIQMKNADMSETDIKKIMATRVKMRVFSWQGERDTTLSPMDSIRYYKRFLNTGFLSMDPRNGAVKAWVGGINFKHFKFDHVEQSKRQPGSTFKPFVYVGAIDRGRNTCDVVVDQPVTFDQSDGVYGEPYTPKNSEGGYSYRPYTLREAIGKSVNSISAFLMKELKPKTVVQYAHNLGITSKLDAVPALCLGVSDVSVFEMVAAYSTFANEGRYSKPYFVIRIEDKNGNIINEYREDQKEVLSKETAYKMLYLLRGATMPGGTAAGLSRYGLLDGNEIAAKTGTTSNYSDGWFMGIAPNLVNGIWVGGDDRSIHFRTIEDGQGARVALPLWGLYMQKVYADATLEYKKGVFTKPANITVSGNCVFVAGESNAVHIDSTQKYVPPSAKPAADKDDQL
jgi:penicillin-binding protein 1A